MKVNTGIHELHTPKFPSGGGADPRQIPWKRNRAIMELSGVFVPENWLNLPQMLPVSDAEEQDMLPGLNENRMYAYGNTSVLRAILK